MEDPPSRIPKNFAPEKYIITFIPDYSNLKYSINTEIIINSLSDKFPYLILNADKYNYKIIYLQLLKFDNIGDEWIEIGKNAESLDKGHLYYFKLPEEDKNYQIQEGLYIPIEKLVFKGEKLKLKIYIEGDISCDMNNALFLSTNLDEKRDFFDDGNKFKEEWISNYNDLKNFPNLSENVFFKNLVTVFMSSPAKLHLNMPSFDEPCYKAIFSFRLELDKYFMDSFKQIKCITNGSLMHVNLDTNKQKYLFTYSDSPLMSSYLFAFVIGNYDLIETVNQNNIKIRVFTPIKNHHDGALCMNLAQNSLKFYEKFFEIPYYYEKLDFVPIPNLDYRAMENIGCIIFKNEAMLFSHFQSILEKKFVSRTICHEISHMWFGDLVTMEWWNDIWLNEGFARIFEYLCLNEIQEKEYNYWDNFIYYIYDKVMSIDESSFTHPIVREVDSVFMIDSVFDQISYSKGASVIKMLMHYIGINNFKKSISIYLKKYKYKNTDTSMLWECFDEVTKLKVSELMKEWVNFEGHPILTIDIISKDKQYFLKLNQKSMLEDDETIWKLPVFVKSKNFEICRLVSTRDYEISFEELSLNYEEIEKGDNFIVFNSDLKGFYRVKYNSNILLNSILTNYKNNSHKQKDIIIKKEEEENSVSDYDIYGLLSMEMKNKNFNNIKTILNKIKPIEKSNLLLTFIKDIYIKFRNNYNILEGFEEFIENNEEKTKITNQIKEYDNFFISLVDNNNDKLNSLVKKFYINEENKDIYRNQFNDEFDSLYLYFRCIIDDNEEVAKFLLVNFEKNFEFLNKNLKYTLIQMMMKYIYLIKDKNEQIKLLNLIKNDYISNYYSSSYNIQELYRNAICNFGSLENSLFLYIYNELLRKKIFNYTLDHLMKGKGNVRKIFDSFLEKVKDDFEKDGLKQLQFNNIFNYFSSDCRDYYFHLKKLWFTGNKDTSSLLYDSLFNYLKSKLGIENGGEDELKNIVKDFSESN